MDGNAKTHERLHASMSGPFYRDATLAVLLERLQPHDHLCLIYDTHQEWRDAIIPFIRLGLAKGEKCVYVVDARTADEIRAYLREEGVDVAASESSGQLTIADQADVYTPGGIFDPDHTIALLIEETTRALAEGYPALRVTGEMTWALRGVPGSERLIEYEAKLNRDFYPYYACVGICQYDRQKFDPGLIKGVVMTHPLLIRGNRIYHDFYYVPPEEILSGKRSESEVEQWLVNIEREHAVIERIQSSADEFERKVEERTFELKNEIKERKAVEKELRATTKKLQDNVEELRRAEQSVREHARKMGTLNQIIHASSEATDTASLATLLIDRTLDLMDFDAGVVFLLNEAENVIELQYSRGFSPDYVKERNQISIDEPHVTLLYRDHEPLWSAPVEFASPDIIEREHITAMAMVPLTAGGRVIGHFSVTSSQRHQFTDEEKDLLLAIGREAGTVVAKLRIEEDLWQRGGMLDLANDAIIIFDLDDIITYWNKGAERLYGWTGDESIGKNIHELLRCEHPIPFDDALSPLYRNGAWDGELIHSTRDNTRLIVESHWTLYRDNDGKPLAILEVNNDITERKVAEEKVRAASLYSRTLIEASLDPLVTISAGGTITDVNKATEDVTGYSREELIGSDFSTYFTDPEQARAGYMQAFAIGYVRDYPLAIRHKSSEITDVLYNATVYRNEAGEVQGVFAAARDVTERKRAEAKIARLNRLYTVLSKANEAMWRIRDPKKLYEEACRIVVEDGLFRMAWIGRTDLETHLVKPIAYWGFEDGYLDSITISAEDVPEGRGPTGTACREGRYDICNDLEHDSRVKIWRAKALKRGYRSSAAFPLKIGTRVIGALTLYANEQLFFDDEEIQLLERLSDDIAFAMEFIEHEEKLRAASLYSRSLLEASLDPLVTISGEGTITDVNKATEEVTGYSREELIGTDFSSYFTEPEKARGGYQQVFTEGFIKDYPLAIRHTSGRITDVLYNATMYRNEAGEVQGVFAAARDVTERKKAEEALRRAHDELEQIVQERTHDLQEEIEEHKVTEEELRVTTEELTRSNKELEQFAYIASHDLQEPLRTVTGSLGLLEQWYKDKLGQEADTFITYAVDGTKHMQQLIKDLLAYSRVTSRGGAFKPMHAEGAIHQALDNLKTAIEESGATIMLPDTPLPMVMADKTQLTQLFQNLIGNAIKFRSTHPPEVQIGVEPDAKRKRWRFSVKDNGIGMDMQYSDKIFTIFQRLHTTEQYPGTGVGLALCRKIVERHGGETWVESELGKGSTFYFTIPVPTEY